MAARPVYGRLQPLAAGLLSHGGFVAAIGGASHFVSMASADFRKFEEQARPEDLPEFTIIQSAYKPRLFASSMMAEVTQTYDFVATLENLSITQLNLAKIHTLIALAHLPEDTLGFPG